MGLWNLESECETRKEESECLIGIWIQKVDCGIEMYIMVSGYQMWNLVAECEIGIRIVECLIRMWNVESTC